MKKYLIIYHKEDNDGVFSAAIIKDYLIRVMKEDANDLEFLGADYNFLSKFAQANDVTVLHEQYSHIIMTDISFNDVKYMKKLYDEFGADFVWCDHHAPIIKASFTDDFDETVGVRDTGRSAILCVYKYLYDPFDLAYNDKKVPELLRILSAWDSWTYEKEGYDSEYVRRINKATTYKYALDLDKATDLVSDIIQTYLTKQPHGVFSALYKDTTLIDELLNLGTVICDVEDQNMENIIKNDGDCSWNIVFEDKDKGRPLYKKACAIFMQGSTSSTMFKCLQHTDIDQGIVFKHKPDGNWTVSLYNIKDDSWVHCGEYLKEKYNGGGHKGAAGCTLTANQFTKILTSKIL